MPMMHKRTAGQPTAALTIRLLVDTYEQIRKYAFEQHMSQTLAMEDLINKGLEIAYEDKKAS